MNPNKQKTDWEKEFRKKHEILEFSNGNWIATGKEVYCKEMEKDISNILQQQREEIIKEIEGIVGDTEPTGLTMDLVIDSAESIRVYGRNQLRKEIRERLKLWK